MDPVSRSRTSSPAPSFSSSTALSSSAPPPLASEPPRAGRLASVGRAASEGSHHAGAATARPATELAALFASSEAARDARVRARLDAVRAAFAGPYRVGGETVHAPAQFRMNGGANDAAAARHRALGASTYGRPATPRELVRQTQQLIDQGALAKFPGPDLPTRIRALQWAHGIGVDCAGYTQLAALAATGATRETLGLADSAGFESLSHLRAPAWSKVPSPAALRPGDVVVLGSTTRSQAAGDQHRVVVHDRRVVETPAQLFALVSALGPDAALHLANAKGPVHVVEVDSSWGAGPDGSPEGGVRRATWAFDEGTGTWFSRHGADGGASGALETSTQGPYGHALEGSFRARQVAS